MASHEIVCLPVPDIDVIVGALGGTLHTNEALLDHSLATSSWLYARTLQYFVPAVIPVRTADLVSDVTTWLYTVCHVEPRSFEIWMSYAYCAVPRVFE